MSKITEVRDITYDDDILIVECFSKAFKDENINKRWMDEYNETHLEEFMFKMIDQKDVVSKIVNDTYLIVYMIVCPWFSDNKYLEECLVLRIKENDVTFDAVIEYLETEAIDNDCIGVLVSTDMARSNKVLSRKYQQYGFTEESVKLYKGV